ncbi:unnamed protein product, partial [marine sediment metagenome]
IMMDVVSLNEEWPTGIAFPVKEVLQDGDEIFPVQLYDWGDVENRVTPLVLNVIEKAFENIKCPQMLTSLN